MHLDLLSIPQLGGIFLFYLLLFYFAVLLFFLFSVCSNVVRRDFEMKIPFLLIKIFTLTQKIVID